MNESFFSSKIIFTDPYPNSVAGAQLAHTTITIRVSKIFMNILIHTSEIRVLVDELISLINDFMRLYSLKHTPHFQFSNPYINTLTSKSIINQRTTYHKQMLIRTVIIKNKCFVAMSLGSIIRQSQIVIQQTTIANLYISSMHVILMGENEYTGWMLLDQFKARFTKNNVSKIILSIKQFVKLPFSHNIKIMQAGNGLIFILVKQRSLFIYKYNQAMGISTQFQAVVDENKSSAIQIIVDDHYYNSNQSVLFLVVSRTSSSIKAVLYELDTFNKLSIHKIIEQNPSKQQVRFAIVSNKSIVVFFNSTLFLIAKQLDKWHTLCQIIPQAQLITLHTWENSIITHEKCQYSYNIFSYCIDDICSFNHLSPQILRIDKEYQPLCKIKTQQKSIWLRGNQVFLLSKPIFKLTRTINQFFTRKQELQNNNQSIQQLENTKLILQNLKSLDADLDFLGVASRLIRLFEVISQFLSIFIHLTAFVNPHLILATQLSLPLDLQIAIRQTRIICTQQLLEDEEKCVVRKRLIDKLKLMSIKAHNMLLIASSINKGQSTIFKSGQLGELLNLCYDSNHFSSFLVMGLKRAYTNQNGQQYLQYRQMLTSMTTYNNELPPFIYILAHQPYQFMLNDFKAQMKRAQMNGQQDEVAQYLQQIHQQQQQLCVSMSLELSINSINKINSQYLQQNSQQQISKEQAFKMAQSMQPVQQLCFSNLDLGIYYNFCCTLKLLNQRVTKIILLQYQQWKFRSSYNQSIYKDKFKDALKQDTEIRFRSSYQSINKDKLDALNQDSKMRKQIFIVQQSFLIDDLLQGYLLRLGQICDQFKLNVAWRLFQKKKQIEFSNLLKDENIHMSRIRQNIQMSRIRQEQDLLYHKEFQIILPLEQQPFKEQLNKTLWEMYLSLTNIQQRHFQVYQHIRDHHFVEQIIDIHHSNLYQPTNRKHNKNGRQFLQQLCENRERYKIKIRQQRDEKKLYYWMNLIELCYNSKTRWLGDPFDLLQQIIQKWYLLNPQQCDKAKDSIYALFITKDSQIR